MLQQIQILEKPVEELNTIDRKFDLVYMDPPFGLQRDFTMKEEDGQEKSFSDRWTSFDDYIDWYAEVINNCLLYTSPSPRDLSTSRMPSSA